jgi:hypothetical protein
MGPDNRAIRGSEIANQVARLGSEHFFIGHEPMCGILAGVAKKAVRDWTNSDHKNYCESVTQLKHAEGFLQGFFVRRRRKLLNLNRNRTTYRTLSPERVPF